MRREIVLIVLIVLASGPVATLVSGLYARDVTPVGSVGAGHIGYGFPLSWFKKVVIVYPDNPTRYSFSSESFIFDTVFWCTIATLLAVIVYRRTQISSKMK